MHKIYETQRPNILDLIKNGEISFIINTPSGKKPKRDQISLRSMAVMRNIPYVTTIQGAYATVRAIESSKRGEVIVKALQDYYMENIR